jgi:protoheme IX farnesyltransferase
MISIFVAFSALTGYVVMSGELDAASLLVFGGILLLAAGSATLNNIQDRNLDRRFSRTSHRPFASGALSVSQGKRQSILLLLIGSVLLYLAPHGPRLLLLGLIAVVCYNLLYTPLKLQTLWAVIPGIISGMIPPLVGWIAAGGPLWSPKIYLVIVLLGLWQLPHAWLIVLAHAEEIRISGTKNILYFFSTAQINRIVFAWVGCFTATLVLLPVFGILRHPLFSFLLVITGVIMIACYAWGLFIVHSAKSYRHLFTLLNTVLGLTMLCCILYNTIVTTSH